MTDKDSSRRIPKWVIGVIGGLAAGLVLPLIANYFTARPPIAVEPTPNLVVEDLAASVEEVHGVMVHDEEGSRTDIQMRASMVELFLVNRGDAVSTISQVDFLVHRTEILDSCVPGGDPVARSAQYDVQLPTQLGSADVSVPIEIRHQIDANDTDRFAFSAGNAHEAQASLAPSYLYEVEVLIHHDQQEPLSAGTAIVAAPLPESQHFSTDYGTGCANDNIETLASFLKADAEHAMQLRRTLDDARAGLESAVNLTNRRCWIHTDERPLYAGNVDFESVCLSSRGAVSVEAVVASSTSYDIDAIREYMQFYSYLVSYNYKTDLYDRGVAMFASGTEGHVYDGNAFLNCISGNDARCRSMKPRCNVDVEWHDSRFTSTASAPCVRPARMLCSSFGARLDEVTWRPVPDYQMMALDEASALDEFLCITHDREPLDLVSGPSAAERAPQRECIENNNNSQTSNPVRVSQLCGAYGDTLDIEVQLEGDADLLTEAPAPGYTELILEINTDSDEVKDLLLHIGVNFQGQFTSRLASLGIHPDEGAPTGVKVCRPSVEQTGSELVIQVLPSCVGSVDVLTLDGRFRFDRFDFDPLVDAEPLALQRG